MQAVILFFVKNLTFRLRLHYAVTRRSCIASGSTPCPPQPWRKRILLIRLDRPVTLARNPSAVWIVVGFIRCLAGVCSFGRVGFLHTLISLLAKPGLVPQSIRRVRRLAINPGPCGHHSFGRAGFIRGLRSIPAVRHFPLSVHSDFLH